MFLLIDWLKMSHDCDHAICIIYSANNTMSVMSVNYVLRTRIKIELFQSIGLYYIYRYSNKHKICTIVNHILTK